jgi:hypothetical protein
VRLAQVMGVAYQTVVCPLLFHGIESEQKAALGFTGG